MDKNFSAKKYFISKFTAFTNNDNKILAHKRLTSVREILNDYIEIHKDVIENIENDKFEKARMNLIECMSYFLKESILYEHPTYKNEIITLISQIDNLKKDEKNDQNKYIKLNSICTSFLKKLNNYDIYEYMVEKIKKTKTFNEIDKIINELISELLYEDYSLKYISEWFKKEKKHIGKINEENIDELIDKFKYFKKNKEIYTYYICLNKDLNEEQYIDLNIKLEKVTQKEIEILKLQNDIFKFIKQGSNVIPYKIKIKSPDIYKGLEILKKSTDAYFQVINNVIDDKKNHIKLTNKCIVLCENGKYQKLRIEDYENEILFGKLENREKKELKDFIEYRDLAYKTMENTGEISNIQRAINIIKNQKEQSDENRFINLWSIMEYTLNFHKGNSIISNVKEIIPKVVCLYSIKDQINIFWNQLYKFKNSNIGIVKEFISECQKNEDEYQYDINKLLSFIQTRGEKLIQDFEFNGNLQRSIGLIGDLLNNEENREKYIKKINQEVECDVVRLYRTRNMLIHAGKNNIININYKSLRLYKYNSHLIALIIYYKNKNPYLTISEILNSIEYTYNDYINKIKEKDIDKIYICKPSYLFV